MNAGDERAHELARGLWMFSEKPIRGRDGFMLIRQAKVRHGAEDVIAHLLCRDIERRRDQRRLHATPGERGEAGILIAELKDRYIFSRRELVLLQSESHRQIRG